MHIRKIVLGSLVFLSVCTLSLGAFSVVYATHQPGHLDATPGGQNAGNAPLTQVRNFPSLISFALGTINQIIVLILALGVVWTIYLAFVLIKTEGEKKDEARNSIIYGLVGIFVMVSIWGLVNIFKNTFDLDNDTKPRAPTLSV